MGVQHPIFLEFAAILMKVTNIHRDRGDLADALGLYVPQRERNRRATGTQIYVSLAITRHQIGPVLYKHGKYTVRPWNFTSFVFSSSLNIRVVRSWFVDYRFGVLWFPLKRSPTLPPWVHFTNS